MRTFEQITSAQHLFETDKDFRKFEYLIKQGKTNLVIEELLTYPKSDLPQIPYTDILQMASVEEYIVYDDFNYLLTFGDGSITLYQEI